MNEILDLFKPIVSAIFSLRTLITLGELALVTLATIGATQFAKVIARVTNGRRFDELMIHLIAIVFALAAARTAWTDHTGWLVGGMSAYAMSIVIAKYGILALRHYLPALANLLQGRKEDS